MVSKHLDWVIKRCACPSENQALADGKGICTMGIFTRSWSGQPTDTAAEQHA